MNITLRPDVEKRITEKVRNGDFDSVEAAVEQAIDFYLGFEEQEMGEEEYGDIRDAIHDALEQGGQGEGVSLEEFDRSMRAKYGIQH